MARSFLAARQQTNSIRSYVFEVPQDWLVLRVSKQKRLPKVAKELQVQATQTGEREVKQRVTQLVTQQVKSPAPAVITAQMKAKVSADPSLMQDQTQLQVLQQKVTA